MFCGECSPFCNHLWGYQHQSDLKKRNKLIKMADSVLGSALEPLELDVQRTFRQVRTIRENLDRPHNTSFMTVTRLHCIFNQRLATLTETGDSFCFEMLNHVKISLWGILTTNFNFPKIINAEWTKLDSYLWHFGLWVDDCIKWKTS